MEKAKTVIIVGGLMVGAFALGWVKGFTTYHKLNEELCSELARSRTGWERKVKPFPSKEGVKEND